MTYEQLMSAKAEDDLLLDLDLGRELPQVKPPSSSPHLVVLLLIVILAPGCSPYRHVGDGIDASQHWCTGAYDPASRTCLLDVE